MKALSERQYYKQIVSQNLSDKASHYHRFAFIEQAMGADLLEGLDLIKINPTLILDLGSGTGHDTERLAARYPKAGIIQLDLSPAMLHAAQYRFNTKAEASAPGVAPHYLCADAEAIPLKANSVDLVFSNALLPWLPDCAVIFKEVRRVLKTDGLFLFSSLGPDTLKECSQVFARINRPHVHEHTLLIDMHDIGDQLVQEFFDNPVMDTNIVTIEYKSPFALLRDLHRTGWSYAIPSMDKNALKFFLSIFSKQYEDYRNNAGAYPATLERVIGHAWCGTKNEEMPTLNIKVC